MQETWKSFLSPMLPGEWLARQGDGPCFGVGSAEGRLSWRMERYEADGPVLRESYVEDGGGLRLEVELTRLDAHRAFCARTVLSNPGPAASAGLRRVEPLRIAWRAEGEQVRVRKAGGGLNEWTYPPEAFRVETARCLGNAWVGIESGWDGRSSNKDLPFLAVCAGESGLVTGLEWSGTWYQDFRGGPRGTVAVSGGVRVDGLVLEPGERLALPAAHYVYFDGGLDGATNAFRRYVYEHVLPGLAGERPLPPVCYNTWFGVGPDISEDFLMAQADAAAELGMEYFVVDAGWYAGCPGGDFQPGVGNWEVVDADKFPRGLEPVARYVSDRGMGFGLWFEPERAHRGSHWAAEHPDWFWDAGGDYLHINLGLDSAREAVVRVVGDAVERLDARWVKLDYNIGPKRFWDKADPTGKAMFRYVEGLYRVLDELVRRHPQVLWECCASGGRRIDLGTLRRAHSAWISDHVGSAAICRFMQTGANCFLPGNINQSCVPLGRHGGTASLTPYELACRMAGALSIHGDAASLSQADRELVRRMVELYKSFRHLLVQDFYALTPHPKREDEWDAVEFCSRDGREAVVMAFSFLSDERRANLRLRGLRADTEYDVLSILPERRDGAGGTGAVLMGEGIPVSLHAESASFFLLRAR